MSMIFDGPQKEFFEMLEEMVSKSEKNNGDYYTKETACDICGSARKTDTGFCDECDAWVHLVMTVFKLMPNDIEEYVLEHKKDLEGIYD